jgi:hypothetical protein
MAHLIQKWIANDGSEWRSEREALKRDELLQAVDVALQPLGPRIENSREYRQHSPATVRVVRLALYVLVKPYLQWAIDAQKEKGWSDERIAMEGSYGWFGRMLDSSCAPLELAYGRIGCIDESNREWQQPYYASNPPKDAVCIEASHV